VSSDGERIAVVLRAKNRPARLVVWSTASDEDAERKWRQRQEEILKRDPEDVAAVRTGPLPRKILHSLESHDGPEPTTPRFMPDGKSILFVRFEPDSEGFLHPDLFVWTLETGGVRRITRNADLRDPDPSPNGRWAVAVRNRDGSSQIVRVDLGTGAVQALTEPSVDEVFDRPRISPAGRRIAYALHREGTWRLVLQEIEGGGKAELAPPAGGTVSSPAWSPDGRTVFAVVGLRGFIDIYAFPVGEGSAPVPLTRTQGAALAPTPAPDGSSLFFLSLEFDGFDLRRLSLPARGPAAAAVPPAADLPRELAPVIRPPAPARPERLAPSEISTSRPYGAGRQELSPLLGGSAASTGGVWELGLRGGDVVGRLDWLILGALGERGWPEGGAAAAAWRGQPVELGVHLFRSRERPTDEEDVARRGSLLDLSRQGFELSAFRDWQWSGGGLAASASALWNEVEPVRRGEALDQRIAGLRLSWNGYRRRDRWHLRPAAGAHYEAGRSEGSGSWVRWGGAARLGLRYDDSRLDLTWRRDGSRGLAYGFDLYQLGGPETSLLPESALSNRIAVPALPVGTLLGEDHEGLRAELSLDSLPAPFFYERHRLSGLGESRGKWLSLAGFEYRFSIGPLPIGRLPALDLRLGVARILEDPFAELEGDDFRWWLTTTWRP
jgi:hypothetical protein